MKNSDLSVKSEIMETLVLENEYKIVVHLFGAAYAAPNKGTTNLILIYSIESSRIQRLFKAFE